VGKKTGESGADILGAARQLSGAKRGEKKRRENEVRKVGGPTRHFVKTNLRCNEVRKGQPEKEPEWIHNERKGGGGKRETR